MSKRAIGMVGEDAAALLLRRCVLQAEIDEGKRTG
jgi:hypothetical protein